MPHEPGTGLTVFSRPGCHLCEILIERLQPLVRGIIEISVRNIETREDWLRDYGTRIPVVVYRGRVICEQRLDRDAVIAALADRDEPHEPPASA